VSLGLRQLFLQLNKMKIRIIKKYPLIVLIIFLSVMLAAKLFGVVINITPSMKRGVYIKTHGEVKRGDIVAACLDEPYKTIGLKNFYIEKGQACNGSDPVIKQVIAIPNDDVVWSKNGIIVNNITFDLPVHNKDSKGKILNHTEFGEYSHTKGYWLIGTNSTNSWDSRYWGDLKKEQILYKLKALML
jgi:conjugative transfer signal peptidase TraF